MNTFTYEKQDDDNHDDETKEMIDKLLNTLENDKYEDLMELTFSKIKKIKNDILQKLQLTRNEIKSFHKKLKEYRYIDEINELKIGNYIRCIKITNPEKITLNNGGIIIDIEVINSSLLIKCKNFRNQIFNIKFEEYLVFQKFNNEEYLLLSVLSKIQK